MRIAIYTSTIPCPTFVERLVIGLKNANTEICVFGVINGETNNKLKGIAVGYRFNQVLNYSKKLHYARYYLLMLFTRFGDKKKLDSWLKFNGFDSINARIRFYPILYFKPNIIHLQWPKGIEQFMWVKDFGIKIVLSLRGAHINYSPVSHPELAILYRNTFPKIDGFHGVSKAICQEAAQYGADLEKCQVAYSGFDLSQFLKQDFINDFETLKNRPIKIISIGRSHWKKGYHFALDAMSLLKEVGVDFQYDIIGAAGNEELLFQKNQLNLDESVSFLDKVPFNAVKKLIREADVLLLPSVEEGIANVVLEAMLLGTLVITSDCGGMEESVSHEISGFVVPVRNSKAIAENVERIKNSAPQTLQNMVLTAYEKTAYQHNEANMVANMLTLYKSVMN